MEKTINIFNIRPDGVHFCRIKNKNNKLESVYLQAITEEQENSIDNFSKYYNKIRFKLDSGKIIPSDDIFLYGEIDFDNDEDIKNIYRFNLINEDGDWIPSNFDYDNGTFTTINGKVKSYPTFDPLLWLQYCHCLIGKPKRIIIYKIPKVKKK